ncbi:MAG: MBOAT family protein [Clostridiales bacterium]|nr:MBOAT family protein [Clostridiales bacterium]
MFILIPLSVISALLLKWLKNEKIRNTVILVLSLGIFAYYSRKALIFLSFFIVLTYLLGNLVYESRKGETKKKKWLVLSLISLVAVLVYCKYIPAILKWWNKFDIHTISYVSLVSLTGISFLVFSALSYIVDIHRGDAGPGSFIDSALFITFFPKITSGPIVLWKDFSKELHKKSYSIDKISFGINRIILGYAKKLIIADTLGAHILLIKTNGGAGIDIYTTWMLALAYFFQIYYDFSGYSDIAIGLCSIFGYDIKENFHFPYISGSVTDFWRRWHISLGTWFKEYVYIPLGGNRTGNVYFNLAVVFLLTGIWHGANYTFILWGLAHGVIMLFERLVKDKTWYKKIPYVIKWALTVFFVFLAWILFMSPDLKAAGNIYRGLFIKNSEAVNFTWRFFATKKILLVFAVAALGSVIGLFEKKKGLKEKLQSFIDKPYVIWLKYAFLLALFAVDILFLVNSTYSPFIYMQF